MFRTKTNTADKPYSRFQENPSLLLVEKIGNIAVSAGATVQTGELLLKYRIMFQYFCTRRK